MVQSAAEIPWLTYEPPISRPWEDPDWKGERGRVDDLVRKYADMWGMTGQNTSAYLCGHPTMIDKRKCIQQRRCCQIEAMKEEVYFSPAKETPASAAQGPS
jgi:ferredoxin--NADP+ reductase